MFYLCYLVPIIWGALGVLPLLFSVCIYLVLCFLFLKLTFTEENADLKNTIQYPFIGVAVIFIGFYFLKIIPPVPISLKHMGIYRSVDKKNNKYILEHKKNPWLFWQNGEQNFLYQKGDTVYCFSSIFSPTRFSDHIIYQWSYRNNNKWQITDEIKIKLAGGRDQGYRSFAKKQNLQSGDWRIQILTIDRRPIGKIKFQIIPGESNLESHKTIF